MPSGRKVNSFLIISISIFKGLGFSFTRVRGISTSCFALETREAERRAVARGGAPGPRDGPLFKSKRLNALVFMAAVHEPTHQTCERVRVKQSVVLRNSLGKALQFLRHYHVAYVISMLSCTISTQLLRHIPATPASYPGGFYVNTRGFYVISTRPLRHYRVAYVTPMLSYVISAHQT